MVDLGGFSGSHKTKTKVLATLSGGSEKESASKLIQMVLGMKLHFFASSCCLLLEAASISVSCGPFHLQI